MKTKIAKEAILKIISENRKKHEEEYNESIEAYKIKVITKLNSYIKKLEDGEFPNLMINLPKPVSYIKEYDKIYKMISMGTETEIELSETEFSKYVLDDWEWKENWSQTNSFYK